MQALPIFLDDMFNEFVAVILSVTFVLAFGEVCMCVFDLPCLACSAGNIKSEEVRWNCGMWFSGNKVML